MNKQTLFLATLFLSFNITAMESETKKQSASADATSSEKAISQQSPREDIFTWLVKKHPEFNDDTVSWADKLSLIAATRVKDTYEYNKEEIWQEIEDACANNRDFNVVEIWRRITDKKFAEAQKIHFKTPKRKTLKRSRSV